MLDRPIGISELWQDGNGVDGETLTWAPRPPARRQITLPRETKRPVYYVVQAQYQREPCLHLVVAQRIFTRGGGGGAHKPVLAAPHTYLHTRLAPSIPRPIVESEFFSPRDDPSTNKQRDIELSEIFLERFT